MKKVIYFDELGGRKYLAILNPFKSEFQLDWKNHHITIYGTIYHSKSKFNFGLVPRLSLIYRVMFTFGL